MSRRKHCKFLKMLTTRVSRDEARRVKERAHAAGVPLNTWMRRQLELPDNAAEDIPCHSTRDMDDRRDQSPAATPHRCDAGV